MLVLSLGELPVLEQSVRLAELASQNGAGGASVRAKNAGTPERCQQAASARGNPVRWNQRRKRKLEHVPGRAADNAPRCDRERSSKETVVVVDLLFDFTLCHGTECSSWVGALCEAHRHRLWEPRIRRRHAIVRCFA